MTTQHSDTIKQKINDALKHADADYADIRIDDVDSTSVTYRGEELDAASTGHAIGGVVRACYRGGWGTVTFSDIDQLPQRVRDACQCARLVGHEKTCLADVQHPCQDLDLPATFIHDFRDIPLQDKISLLQGYNQILLKHAPHIQSSTANYAETMRTTWFGSTRGNLFREERPRIVLALAATAGDGSIVQNAHESFSSTNDFQVVLNREETARQVAQRAHDLLAAPKCPGGTFRVILDPSMTGIFTHEAFGHLSEADFLYENEKMKDLMKIGKVMGTPELSITDDGTRGTLIGTHRVDDEGTPTQRTELIRDGILVGHLHSLETAAKLGEKPTGNARTVSIGHSPIVRMTNTFMEPGKLSRDQLFADVEDGIYACGGYGGQTQMEMFTFSASYGYRIRNGQVAELLRDVVLTGNVFQTLHNIDGIADDLVIYETGGGCGKGGQAPLPVTTGGPHISVRDVVVGGN